MVCLRDAVLVKAHINAALIIMASCAPWLYCIVCMYVHMTEGEKGVERADCDWGCLDGVELEVEGMGDGDEDEDGDDGMDGTLDWAWPGLAVFLHAQQFLPPGRYRVGWTLVTAQI